MVPSGTVSRISGKKTLRDREMINRLRFNMAILAMGCCCLGGYTGLAGAATPGATGLYAEAEVVGLSKNRFRVRVAFPDWMTRDEVREAGLRAARRSAAQAAPELVTVSRTLAGAEYSERTRVISAALVTAVIEKEEIAGAARERVLDLVVRTSSKDIGSPELEAALIGDRRRAERIRHLESEVRRLEGLVSGLEGDRVPDSASLARRRSAFEALLEAESDIRQTFLAGGVDVLLEEREAEIGAAVRVFESAIMSGLTSTHVDARILSVEPPKHSLDAEWRGASNPRAYGEAVIATMAVSWTLDDGLMAIAERLGRWFFVFGGTPRADHWISSERFSDKSTSACVHSDEPRNPFRHAAALYDYLATRSVVAQVRLLGDTDDKPLAEIEPLVAGAVNGGKWWCIFSGERSARALPFRGSPGVYDLSGGASLSAALPYRVVVPRMTGSGLSHLSTRVFELREQESEGAF